MYPDSVSMKETKIYTNYVAFYWWKNFENRFIRSRNYRLQPHKLIRFIVVVVPAIYFSINIQRYAIKLWKNWFNGLVTVSNLLLLAVRNHLSLTRSYRRGFGPFLLTETLEIFIVFLLGLPSITKEFKTKGVINRPAYWSVILTAKVHIKYSTISGFHYYIRHY